LIEFSQPITVTAFFFPFPHFLTASTAFSRIVPHVRRTGSPYFFGLCQRTFLPSKNVAGCGQQNIKKKRRFDTSPKGNRTKPAHMLLYSADRTPPFVSRSGPALGVSERFEKAFRLIFIIPQKQ
jgi:hypothetical protein